MVALLCISFATRNNYSLILILIGYEEIILIIVTLLATICANAQIMRVDELEKYAKEKYGDKWTEAAANIAKSVQLDKNNAMTFVQVIP